MALVRLQKANIHALSIGSFANWLQQREIFNFDSKNTERVQSLQVGVNEFLQRCLVGALDPTEFVTRSKAHKCGHGTNVAKLTDLGGVVHVDGEKKRVVAQRIGQGVKIWFDSLTGSAPRCRKIDDDETLGCNGFLETLEILNSVDGHLAQT